VLTHLLHPFRGFFSGKTRHANQCLTQSGQSSKHSMAEAKSDREEGFVKVHSKEASIIVLSNEAKISAAWKAWVCVHFNTNNSDVLMFEVEIIVWERIENLAMAIYLKARRKEFSLWSPTWKPSVCSVSAQWPDHCSPSCTARRREPAWLTPLHGRWCRIHLSSAMQTPCWLLMAQAGALALTEMSRPMAWLILTAASVGKCPRCRQGNGP